ncbi:unnamed protein product [Calypogeia fissa]
MARGVYYSLGHRKRMTYILNFLNGRDSETIKKNRIIFSGAKVCMPAFSNIMGFCNQTLDNYCQDYKNSARKDVHGNEGSLKSRPYVLFFQEGIRSLLSRILEPMPHRYTLYNNGVSRTMFRVPLTYGRKDIFYEVSEKVDAQNWKPVTINTFYRMLHDDFREFEFIKASMFAKCEICTSIKEKLKCKVQPLEVSLIKAERDLHMAKQ